MPNPSSPQNSGSEPDPQSAALPEGRATTSNTGATLSTIKIPIRYAKKKLKKPKRPRFRWTIPFERFFFGKAESLRFVFIAFWISLVSSAFFALHVVHFDGRNDTDRIVWSTLPFWQPLESAEYRFYDQRFTSRGIRTPLSHNKIVVIGLDQISLTRFGQWPIPRDYYARLVDRLKKAGAKVIVLDFDFSDFHNPKFDSQNNVILSDQDQILVDSLERAKNVVLPTYLAFDRKTDSKGKTSSFSTTNINFLQAPFEQLDAATADLSLGYLPLDSDGGARRYPWEAIVNPGGDAQANIGSLAGLAIALYKDQVTDQENNAYQLALKTGQVVSADKTVHEVPLTTGRPANKSAPVISTMQLNYWGPETFPTYPFSDVLLGTSGAYSDARLKKIFEGRIVFVGPTAHILKDEFPMPQFNSFSKISNIEIERNRIAGVEIHATAAAMLMDGEFITPPSTQVTLVCLFGLTLFAGVLMGGLRSSINRTARSVSSWWINRGGKKRLHDPVWLGLYVLVGVLPVAFYWYATSWAFMKYHMWLVLIYPALSATVTSSSVLLYSFAVETGERRKALEKFSKLVSPEVMEEILSHPEGQSGAARRVNATVLFSDLEGFTSFSEVHEPEEVIEAINNLFSRLEPVVHAYGGTVDKYIGDAIMAFFGAPTPRFDHAARALHCAIAMQNECVIFREETGIPFYMRVGVHTGEVIVGEVGSHNRSDYTMIGDTVNLASRLEGKNKEFGSYIMCSSSTYEQAPGVALVESASAQIKGKSQNVDVYIVRGLFGQPAADPQWRPALSGNDVDEGTLPRGADRGKDIPAAFGSGDLKALPQADNPDIPNELQTADGVVATADRK